MRSQTGTAPAARRMRADARRNYEKLLDVADAVFDEHGANASLEEIARRAGVSIATLYRHFPERRNLQEAVFLRIADSLRDEAVALLDAKDPLEAFLTWLQSHLVSGACGRGLAASVMSAKLQEGTDVNTSCHQMKRAGAELLARAQAAGQVREGVDLGDLLLVVHGIVLVNEQVPTTADRPQRMLAVVVDGLRR
ncbi:DNA-binding transcriptional regulator, AcrR family [Nonomuraea maritima]|uniref:DNA-binding transcriptional regulator, AcrR family n=1 Tax=Nonomuraea maritima TaxID=683260 RepID=A0A1G8WUH5_9ACTN|nr:TetR/AcrR family transcriptional regulator [Nonomuraea maritima]SDJ81250.1 DNA-binding transcriptional regulator, AcrR family [Nonomuraea maritima]